jgi:hypothetical protein
MIWGVLVFILSWFELVYLIKTSYKLTWRKTHIEKPKILMNSSSLMCDQCLKIYTTLLANNLTTHSSRSMNIFNTTQLFHVKWLDKKIVQEFIFDWKKVTSSNESSWVVVNNKKITRFFDTMWCLLL